MFYTKNIVRRSCAIRNDFVLFILFIDAVTVTSAEQFVSTTKISIFYKMNAIRVENKAKWNKMLRLIAYFANDKFQNRSRMLCHISNVIKLLCTFIIIIITNTKQRAHEAAVHTVHIFSVHRTPARILMLLFHLYNVTLFATRQTHTMWKCATKTTYVHFHVRHIMFKCCFENYYYWRVDCEKSQRNCASATQYVKQFLRATGSCPLSIECNRLSNVDVFIAHLRSFFYFRCKLNKENLILWWTNLPDRG